MEASGDGLMTDRNKISNFKIGPHDFMQWPFKLCSGKKRDRIRSNRDVYEIAKANLVLINSSNFFDFEGDVR